MKLNSKKSDIQASSEKVFGALTNCNLLQKYIPNVQNWTSTEDECSFTVAGVGNLVLKIVEKLPFEKVVYRAEAAMSQHIEAAFLIEDFSEKSTLEINAEVDVPFFIAQMVKSSLQKMIDSLVDQIKLGIETTIA
ncbi:MAG: hypothetical protein J5606_03335 [Bacteroidales bacterium]|nr:hypothetical protein [Bacteroidales bacterium]